MTKITSSFLTLVLIIVFSSIVYIWQAEAEKKQLNQQISTQQKQIEQLTAQIKKQTQETDTNSGAVQGAAITSTGEVSGTISLLSQIEVTNTVVCATEVYTKQEYCTDLTAKKTDSEFSYTFDIPLGTYELYIVHPVSKDKVYYSEIQTCDENNNCFSDPKQKRLIKVIQEDSQTDINISI